MVFDDDVQGEVDVMKSDHVEVKDEILHERFGRPPVLTDSEETDTDDDEEEKEDVKYNKEDPVKKY